MVDTDALKESVIRILAIELRMSAERVRSGKRLRADLGLDSIAAANATFMLEEEWGVEIELEDGESFDTIDEIVEMVQRAFRR